MSLQSLEEITSEKARLESEKAQLQTQLDDSHSQGNDLKQQVLTNYHVQSKSKSVLLSTFRRFSQVFGTIEVNNIITSFLYNVLSHLGVYQSAQYFSATRHVELRFEVETSYVYAL